MNHEFHGSQCRLCGSTKQAFLYQKDNEIFAKCLICGLISLQRIPSVKDLTTYYSDLRPQLEKTGQMSLDGRTKISLELRASRYLKAIEGVNGISANSRLLDFGCGRGFFLNLAKKDGYDVYGLDINPLHIEQARETGAKIFDVKLKDANFPDCYFDIITAIHVLEHLEDPFSEIEEMIRILRKDGILVIGVPNANSLWHKLYGSDWIWNNPKEHIYHFSLESSKFMMNKIGLNIIYTKTFPGHNASIFPNKSKKLSQDHCQFRGGGVIERGLYLLQQRQISILIYKSLRLIARELCFATVSPFLNQIISLFGFGDDLMVIARKL